MLTGAEIGHQGPPQGVAPFQAMSLIGNLVVGFRVVRLKTEAIDLRRVRQVLVVRTDEIDDVVMSTPFLRELRRLLPAAWITLLVKPAVYNLVERCPYVHEVLTFDWSGSRYLEPFQRRWRALVLAHRHLWPGQFDMAILPRWDADYYYVHCDHLSQWGALAAGLLGECDGAETTRQRRPRPPVDTCAG